MKRIPEGLTLNSLSSEQIDIFRLAYERAVMKLRPRHYREKRVSIAFFEPLSPSQKVERELFELGLFARVHANPKRDGVPYGFTISYSGFNWYEQHLAADEHDA